MNQDHVDAVYDIEPVWSGHVVGFSLLTHPPHQYAAYYDADRRMTIARRSLDSAHWLHAKLPSTLGWDSHNAVTMALDSAGYLHVAGNMHAAPMIYFRMKRPGDITSFHQVEHMADAALEQRVTYPQFLRGANDELLFRYRDGGSGCGNDHCNRYNVSIQSWEPLNQGPLLDGGGKMNGYFSAPERGPDGRFHMVGVWRDSPDAATNHDPSYACSDDLQHWEKADGTPLPLPMTVHGIDIVERIRPGEGLINGNCRLGFDQLHRPIVTYTNPH